MKTHRRQRQQAQKEVLIVIVTIIAMFLLWKSQQPRLNAYSDWYECEIYGQKEYCK
jgi:hypothetical protein